MPNHVYGAAAVDEIAVELATFTGMLHGILTVAQPANKVSVMLISRIRFFGERSERLLQVIHAALFFTVVLIVVTAYFLMGGTPLLILKHDTPKDAQFIRNFFNLYYKLAIYIAIAASVGYALAGRPGSAIGAAAIALLAALLRSRVIPAMELVGTQIQANQVGATQRFRRLHIATLLINLAQFVAIGWGLTRISL